MLTMDDFKDLLSLPGSPQAQAWLEERLKTLSVREQYVLTAALMWLPPNNAIDAVNHIWSLDDYEVRFPAGSYEQLGELYLRKEARMPEDAIPYVNLEKIGQGYEDAHPGLFVGSCYVTYPNPPVFRYSAGPLFEDTDWSVKLKLASPTVPEGVWLRLPGRDGKVIEESDEVVLALHELKAKSLEECTLLEARCILPEVGDLMDQYDSITELVKDGDNLGYALDERGQGEAHWMEKFTAALKYEDCRTLRFALDISQNLHCYDWVPQEDLEVSAEGLLLDAGVPAGIIHSGSIDLRGYKAHLLESTGYVLAQDKSGYIARNSQEFVCEFSEPEQSPMTMQ